MKPANTDNQSTEEWRDRRDLQNRYPSGCVQSSLPSAMESISDTTTPSSFSRSSFTWKKCGVLPSVGCQLGKNVLTLACHMEKRALHNGLKLRNRDSSGLVSGKEDVWGKNERRANFALDKKFARVRREPSSVHYILYSLPNNLV